MRSSVLRQAVIPIFAILLCSCSSSDSLSGLSGESTADGVDPATSTIGFARTDLGTLGGTSSYAADINNSNVVVGWSETLAGTTHAFRWSAASGLTDLGTLPGDRLSRAIAILDGDVAGGGQILGVSGDEDRWTPVVWSASGVIRALAIPLMPAFSLGSPTGFNTRGDVVGWDAGGPGQHGWSWSSSVGKYDLSANVQGGSNEGSAGDVTESGVVLLTSRAYTCTQVTECWRTYLWNGTAGYTPLGTPGNGAEADVTGLALNETGAVVGWATTGRAGVPAPYRWSAGSGFTFLARYAGTSSAYGYATAVNSAGAIVGATVEPESGSIVATTWPGAGGIVRLSRDDPNPSVAVAINNFGTIAGWATVSSGGNHAVMWSPVSNSSRAIQSMVTPMRRISTASAPCLGDVRAITSRQALFACVLKSDKR
jgi:probable HAF family extracellular repeat protein